MDEKPDQIMNHIESQRNQLGRNLNELEDRVRRTTDWRAQFDRNPMLMMGVALGGGLLLGTMVGGSSRRSSGSSWSSSAKNYSSSNYPSSSYSSGAGYGVASNLSSASSASTSPAMREHRRKASDTLEHIKGALIGFATAKVKEFMTEALPGFNQHLDEAERRHNELNSSSGQHSSSGSQENFSGGSQPGYSGSGQSGYSGGGQQNFSSGQQNTGYQGGSGPGSNPGGTRTEQSSQSPYRQPENVRS